MSATDVLREEHELIKRMLAILEEAARRLQGGEEVLATTFRDGLDFIRTFADGCHHRKEENALFPALEARGMPRQGGPIAVMLHEHDEGRAFVRALAEAVDAYDRGDASARDEIVRSALGYAQLLHSHIAKENKVLFPMSERILSPREQEDLAGKFEAVEQGMGSGTHQRYEELVGRLERELGLA